MMRQIIGSLFHRARLTAVAALTLAAATPLEAHHSFAMFDQTKNEVISGTVSEFSFDNPHIHWRLTAVAPGKQAPDSFIFEGPTPVILKRLGWTRKSMAVGDKIKVEFHPWRDGNPGGQAIKVWLKDGTSLSLVAEDVQYK